MALIIPILVSFLFSFLVKFGLLAFLKNRDQMTVITYLHVNKGTKLFLDTLKWFLRGGAMLSIYNFGVNEELQGIPFLLGFILPNLFYMNQGIKQWVTVKLLKLLRSLLGHRFKVCPFCKECHIFLRYTSDSETAYYYLLTEEDSLVGLGDADNPEHPAYVFLSHEEEQFEELSEKLAPYFLPATEEEVFVGGKSRALIREIHCVDCGRRVSVERGAQFGEVLLDEAAILANEADGLGE